MSKSSNIKYQVSSIRKPKIAIVHDWLYGGGAELVVEELHKLYPEAPIYTSYCTDEWRKRLNGKVITGYLQNTPFAQLRKFLPVLRQHWFKNLDLSEFDLVISSSGNGEAKFVLSGKQKKVKSKNSNQAASSDINYQVSNMGAKRPLHICYCHTPTHFYWRKYDQYLENPGFRPRWLVRFSLKLLLKPLRKRDYKAARRVDYFIANSSHIQHDIEKFYNKQSAVIHPPVDVEKFKAINPSPTRTGFIIWGRHVPYKRIDLAIRACNELGVSLTVVGSGPQTQELKKIAGPTITFAGRVSDEELVTLAHRSEAFIFPSEEDFGIAPVEALAAGLPVIAYRSGGALDYVISNKTGIFFEEQTVDSVKKALKSFNSTTFNSSAIESSAKKFSQEQFRTKFTHFVKNKVN